MEPPRRQRSKDQMPFQQHVCAFAMSTARHGAVHRLPGMHLTMTLHSKHSLLKLLMSHSRMPLTSLDSFEAVMLRLQALHRPATSLTCTLLGGIYLYITTNAIGYDQVGLSYEKAVGRCEFWRIITGMAQHDILLVAAALSPTHGHAHPGTRSSVLLGEAGPQRLYSRFHGQQA